MQCKKAESTVVKTWAILLKPNLSPSLAEHIGPRNKALIITWGREIRIADMGRLVEGYL